MVYEGDFQNDLMHGKGVLTSVVEGSEFSGDFTMGKRDGYGIYKYANKDLYVGEWLNNQMHGKGKYTWAVDGRTTVGKWQFGKKHGEHMFQAPDRNEKHFWDEGRLLKKGIILSF